MNFEYSIVLMDDLKIDITEAEIAPTLIAIRAKESVIVIGKRHFAHHQFKHLITKKEADFREKMSLRIKGYQKCRKYGVVHKLGEICNCKESGEIDPTIENLKQLQDKY